MGGRGRGRADPAGGGGVGGGPELLAEMRGQAG